MKVTWKVIAGVVLSVFVVLVIFNMIKNQKETYFKQIQLDTTNVVFNNTEKKFLDTIVNVGLTQLNLEDIVVTIFPLTEGAKSNFSTTGELKAHIREQDGYYYIWIDDLSRYESVEVITHELIHLKQYHDKRLLLEGNLPVWLDEAYPIETTPYENRPWEIEAFSDGKELKNKVETILFD